MLRFLEGLQVRVLRVENIPALGHEQRKAHPFRKAFPECLVVVRCRLQGIDVIFEPGERFFEVHGASPFRVTGHGGGSNEVAFFILWERHLGAIKSWLELTPP